jgi:hypothetical protein
MRLGGWLNGERLADDDVRVTMDRQVIGRSLIDESEKVTFGENLVSCQSN